MINVAHDCTALSGRGLGGSGRVTIDGHCQTGFFGNVEVGAMDKAAIASGLSPRLCRAACQQGLARGLILAGHIREPSGCAINPAKEYCEKRKPARDWRALFGNLAVAQFEKLTLGFDQF